MASVPAWRDSSPFKIEFFSDAGGKPRRHRARYYTTSEGMVRAGRRWEDRGSDYWCRYWNGLNTWVSVSRSSKPQLPIPIPRVLIRAVELASAIRIKRSKEKRE
jgi:hypothetical protein